MTSRKILDKMYEEKFQAEHKLAVLKQEGAFQCCTTCNESPSYQAHIEHVRWLEEKIKLLDLLIDIYLSDQ